MGDMIANAEKKLKQPTLLEKKGIEMLAGSFISDLDVLNRIEVGFV